jgi:hypothetical protein
MRYRTPSLACVGLALLLAACGGGGEGGSSNPPGPGPANTAPTANAGSNQTVTAGSAVTLNGSQSSDADGSIATYAWSQSSGLPVVSLSNASDAQPTFMAPQVVTATTLRFSLVVTDNRGLASAPATVFVTINPQPANVTPIANAGQDQAYSSGETVFLNGTSSSDPDGSIATYAWSQTAGTPVIAPLDAIAQPSFTAPTVATSTTLTFSLTVTDNRGGTSAADTVAITILPPSTGNVTVTGRVTFGRVPLNLPPLGLNYGNPVQQNARNVVISALRSSTQTEIATTITGADGTYTLSVPNNTSIVLRVQARLLRLSPPIWDVQVKNGTGGMTYAYTDGAPFVLSAAVTRDIAIPTGINASGVATGDRASGPFAILDTIYQSIQTVVAVEPNAIFPALTVDWGSQANGTFFTTEPPQHIALLADLTEDTDEFDQHVIAHEFGHYLEHNFSRADSIGGSHSIGQRLDPRVAFGEGFGYAFAAIVLNDTNARDSYNDNGIQRSGGFNIETNPATVPPANAGDGLGCWCSESSVWSILWDINDSAADANDNVALGFGPIWQVLTGPQRTTPAFTTIFSFVSALKAAGTGQNAAIDTLVGAQNITTAGMDAFATTETHSPLSLSTDALPIYTTITSGTPVVVRSVDDEGNYNKVGNHRFLRFLAPSTGNVTVTLTSSNPNNADPDFRVFRAGTLLTFSSEDPPPQPETDSFAVTAGTTYVLDVHDCANGCSSVQGVAGDYDLTVTIN